MIMKKKKPNKLFVFIPYFFTFANAFFGFLSIMYALDGNCSAAAYSIFFAALMDGFDGRLARLLGVSSYLGMELDSLCDAISFCLAPAVLLYSSFLHDGGFTAIIVLAFYLCAGLFRLAKFNLTSEKQSTSFLGLPTTIAAFFLSTLVLYHERVSTGPFSFLTDSKGIMAVIIFLAMLMISSIPFPTFKKRSSWVMSHLLIKLIVGTILATFVFMKGIPLLFFVLLVYIVVSFATACYLFVVEKYGCCK